jgi:hypothetical protein
MCYEKKLDVSKTEVHSIALVQSIYNNIRSNLFVMLRICGEIDLNILLYVNTGISVGYFVKVGQAVNRSDPVQQTENC